MKKNLKHIIFLMIFLLAASASQSQTVNLTIDPQGTPPYTAGNSFPVKANYGYTNISGDLEIIISFDNQKLGYSITTIPYIPSNSGNTTTLKFTIPATGGNNQSGVIMMSFYYLCSSSPTCFGTDIPAQISGSIKAVNHNLTQNATNANIIGRVINNWTGQHTLISFVQSSYEVTYKVSLSRNGSCFKITNPKFFVTPSVGILSSVTNATLSGNTFTPVNPSELYGNNYVYYYTIKLPCNTPSGTVVTSTVRIEGNNCNNQNVTIYAFPDASYTLPASIPSASQATLTTSSEQYSTGQKYFKTIISNTGNTPLNLTLTNNFPAINTTSISQSTFQPNVNCEINQYECSNNLSTTQNLIGNFSTSVTLQYMKKAVMNITNLLPGHYIEHKYDYNLSNSCNGTPNESGYQMISNLSYNCATTGLSQICNPCIPGAGGTASDTAEYFVAPDIVCNQQSYPSACMYPGDTVQLCLSFKNLGSAPLTGGVISFNLNNKFTYLSGLDVYTGFTNNPTYQSPTSVKWSIPSIPAGNTEYKICFKVKVNDNAPYGITYMYYSVTGNNYTEGLQCNQRIEICAFPKAEVEKLVKGNKDQSFGTSGNGTPGSVAEYKIIVKNTGNATIGNIVLVDRFPITGVNTIMECTPRISQFELNPSGALTISGANIEYSNTLNASTGWTDVPNCNTNPANWSSIFQPKNVKINLISNIAPDESQTFTIPVLIPPGTSIGKLACNTIGMRCDLIDNENNASPMLSLESNPVCLTVVADTLPPSGCCKDFLKRIRQQHTLTNNILNVNSNITVGPQLVSHASVSLVDFHIFHPKDCDVCLKDPKYMGNIMNPGGSLNWNHIPTGVPWSHMIQWNDSLGVDWNSGVPLNFEIPLPPKSPISCCCDSIFYCLKYSFTDINCITCDTIICSKVPCSPNQSIDCKCKGLITHDMSFQWKDPEIIRNGTANCPNDVDKVIDVICENTPITGNFFQYSCEPKDCNATYTWKVIYNNETQVAGQVNSTSTDFSFTPNMKGKYELWVTPVCGVERCEEVCAIAFTIKNIKKCL